MRPEKRWNLLFALALFTLILIIAVAAAPPDDYPPRPDISLLPDSDDDGGPTEPSDISVSLLYPDDGAQVELGYIEFHYDSGSTAGLTCELRIDGSSVIEHQPNPSFNVQTVMYRIAIEGSYNWLFACTDGQEWGYSDSREIEVEEGAQPGLGPFVLTEKTYSPGDTVEVLAAGFPPYGTASLRMLQEEETIFTETGLAIGVDGSFTFEFELEIDDTGEFLIIAWLSNDADTSAERSFTVELPTPVLRPRPAAVDPGDQVLLRGSEFLEELDVVIRAFRGETLLDTETLETNDEGRFNYEFDVPEDEPEGVIRFVAEMKDMREVRANATVNVRGIGDPLPFYLPPTFPPLVDPFFPGGPIGPIMPIEGPGNTQFGPQNYTLPQTKPTGPSYNTTQPPIEGVCPDGEDCDEDEGGLAWWIWLLIFLIILLLICGGIVGYAAYEGNFDYSSPEAFLDGLKRTYYPLFYQGKEKLWDFVDWGWPYLEKLRPYLAKVKINLPEKPQRPAKTSFGMPGAKKAVSIRSQDAQVLQRFISKERGKGYDDLTIRNALMKKGWSPEEVDAMFDKMYK